MNPFESARIESAKLRSELESAGVRLDGNAYSITMSACKLLDVALREVNHDFPLLMGADATIKVERRWVLVRKDLPSEIKAFLIAHELGHLRLHPSTIGVIEVSQDTLKADNETNGLREVESYGARERLELQANVFAREFLLPRVLARNEFLIEKKSASEISTSWKLPHELVRLQLYDAVLLPKAEQTAKIFRLPDSPSQSQAPAVNSDEKTSLVEAGPGTGKTTTLLLRLRRLIASGTPPESIVILTFSNKAARELVERARAGNIPGADRVWIGTFHAFGLEFLRKFGNLYGLDPNFPVLDKLAALRMLEEDITSADLKVFDPLSNPSPWLENALDTIRRSKDEVFDAADFTSAILESTSGDPETDAKRHDVATIFERYELLLARRKAVDLSDLLSVSIRLLQSSEPAIKNFLGSIHHVMVDEYQDVNRASALLVKALAKGAKTLWVVGDANQAIYAFMGASSSNLAKFQVDFPGAISIPLPANHRSSQEIVDSFDHVASLNPAGRPTITLKAERGYLGSGPRLIHTSDGMDELRALAWRLRQLESSGTPLAEQAVIVYKNADASELATGLEQLGVPVLYLGNIFERPEIKDLICLIQLAIDPYGVNLVRHWYSPLLALSREGADRLFAQTRQEERGWREVSGKHLSSGDNEAWNNLSRLCGLITENTSPWEALSAILLEDGVWLRQLASLEGQAAANALMAVWQFVHFSRLPDGTGRWPTLKSLPHRIRDRVRLAEDRSMRAVPPEAEGMNAVRILTAHGSKGLEFDAVHFLRVTKNTYETPRRQTNKLIPDVILEGSSALDTLKNERHNLLYVAVSRPRFHLTVYSMSGEELPSALDGLLTPLGPEWRQDGVIIKPITDKRQPAETQVSLEEYLQFVNCPQRHEMSSRAGKQQREELKVHRAVDIATRKAMTQLPIDIPEIDDTSLHKLTEAAVESLGLHELSAASLVRERVEERIRRGLDLLKQAPLNTSKITLSIGPLKVELMPDQVFQDGAVRRLRLIKANKSAINYMKQPLAALLDAHHQTGGMKTTIEIATLSDSTITPVGTIRASTRGKYEALAIGLCAKHFPATPSSEHTCHFCGYMFPCSKRSSE